MKGTVKVIRLLVISLLASAFGGCGANSEAAMGENHYAPAQGMESTPIIEYIVPQATANVLVDRLGYEVYGRKEAVVKGRELPRDFRLIDAESGQVVYKGSIEKSSQRKEDGISMGYAVFDDYEQSGTYYLECDKIGQSHPFVLVEEQYIELLGKLTEKVLRSCEESTASTSEITALLTAYEWYPGLFGDENENDIPDILEQIALWLEIRQNEEANIALLAKFSYLYQKYDKKYATTCLQSASALFEKSRSTMQKDADSFYALTELYRASGLSTYRKQIQDYKDFFENNSNFGDQSKYLYGAITYMVTRQRVDVDLCNVLLDTMMDRGEEISNWYEDMIHPVAAKNNGTEEILSIASEVIFVNYVLNGYQYHSILEEILHYLGGRNVQSFSFYEAEEDCTGYILLLAQLASIQEANRE